MISPTIYVANVILITNVLISNVTNLSFQITLTSISSGGYTPSYNYLAIEPN